MIIKRWILIFISLSFSSLTYGANCPNNNYENKALCQLEEGKFEGHPEKFLLISELSLYSDDSSQDRHHYVIAHGENYKEKVKRLNDFAIEAGKVYSEENSSIEFWSRTRRIGADGVEMAGDIVGELGSIPTPATKATLLIKYGTRVLSKGVHYYDEYHVAKAKGKADSDFSKITSHFLKDLFESGELSKENFAKASKEELSELSKKMREQYSLDPTNMSSWGEKQRDMYTQYALNKFAQIQNAFNENNNQLLHENKEVLDDLLENFKEASKDIGADLAELSQKSDELDGLLNELQQDQGGLKKGLEEILAKIQNSEIKEMKKDVIFIKTFAMGKMSATELKELIEKDILNLTNLQSSNPDKSYIEDINAFNKQLEAMSRVEKINAKMKKINTVTGDLANIAKNIGFLDAQQINDINKGLSLINGMGNIFTGYLMSSPMTMLGGFSALTSVFGKTGPDPAAERHRQIMQALGKLFDGQKKILKSISLLGENMNKLFEQSYKNQKLILEAISDLDRKITDFQLANWDKLDKIHYATLINREILAEIISEDMGQSCDSFIKNFVKYPIKNYDDFHKRFENNVDYFEKCKNGMDKRFSFKDDTFPINNYYQYAFHIGKETGDGNPSNNKFLADQFVDVYNKTIEFIFKSKKLLNLNNLNIINSAYLPVNRFSDLDKKFKSIGEIEEKYFGNEYPTHSDLLRKLIHPKIILEASNYLMKTHSFFGVLVVRDNKLLTEKELLNGDSGSSERMESYLENAIRIIDTSVAQLNMFGGDFTLFAIEKVISQAQADGDNEIIQAMKKKAVNLLWRNPLLAKNFVNYLINKELKAKGKNYLSYNLALKESDPYFLKQLTQSPWNFHYNKEIKLWSARFSTHDIQGKEVNFFVDLPSPHELESERILYHADIKSLSRQKKRLKDILMGYRLSRKLGKESKKTFYNLLLLEKMELPVH